MKKILLTSMLATFLFTVNAQTSYGIKAGANSSNLRISANGLSVSYNSRIAAHGGFFANIPVSNNFRVQPEAVFSMEGAQIMETELRLNYVNVPLMFQYSAMGFYGETGPQVGILVSAEAQEDNIVESIKENLETVSLSWGIGAGYRLRNGLGLGVRYNLGLTNIIKDNMGEEGTLKSNVFQFGLSFTFSGSGK